MKTYFTYIITNKPNGVLYIGVTNDIARRIWEHKTKVIKGFSAKYNLDKLVYCEDYSDVNEAIAREKQIKGWRREKKINLIESVNKNWLDLGANVLS